MNLFAEMGKDTIYIERPNGERSQAYKAVIGSKNGPSATIFDESIDVEEGWKLIRELPRGKQESYTILEARYKQGLQGIPASWRLKLSKDSSLVTSKPKVQNTTINISNSTGFQVGDNNTQNIELGIKELLEKIDTADASPEEKSQAKSILKSLLDNQVVAAVLGGAASGLIGLL